MDQRLSLVTLGVSDVAQARAFYERLGWRAAEESTDEIVFFQMNGGFALGLYGRAALAEETKLPDAGPGFGGITLAHNLPTRAAVDALLAEAERAGATILKPAEDVFWGGYSGYFADPDGHAWEVCWNPHMPLGPDGSFVLAS